MVTKNFVQLGCPKDENKDFEILRMLDGRFVVSCNRCDNEFPIGELKELED